MRTVTLSSTRNVMVLMTQSADHVTGATGLTLTITSSKNGGAFASITPTVTERGNGWYNLALTSGMCDTLGDLAIHITATGADPTDLLLQVVAYNSDDATTLGLKNVGYLPAIQANTSVNASRTAAIQANTKVATSLVTAIQANTVVSTLRTAMISAIQANTKVTSSLVTAVQANTKVATSLITAVQANTKVSTSLATAIQANTKVTVSSFPSNFNTLTIANNGVRLSSNVAAQTLDGTIESTYTLRQLLRLYSAVLLGKTSGMGNNHPVFRDIADSKNRITAVTDSSGNRTTVTIASAT